jgi:hypothetical protein
MCNSNGFDPVSRMVCRLQVSTAGLAFFFAFAGPIFYFAFFADAWATLKPRLAGPPPRAGMTARVDGMCHRITRRVRALIGSPNKEEPDAMAGGIDN